MRPHVPDHARLAFRGGAPRAGLGATNRAPAVGYMGHLRGARGRGGDATECFGTSHWRDKPPVSRAEAVRARLCAPRSTYATAGG